MFSGIISSIGTIKKTERNNDSLFFTIERPKKWSIKPGDSIATNGVCLTVRTVGKHDYTTELMTETLQTTTFGKIIPKRVNLERPLTLQTPLDGHLVLGHVDTVGTIKSITPRGRSTVSTITFPARYGRWVAEKGSITVDGIGLTVVGVKNSSFMVSLVDYTLEHTTLGDKKVGDLVNVEFDVVVKYVQRMVKK